MSLLPPATPGALHFPGAQIKNYDQAHDLNFPVKVLKFPEPSTLCTHGEMRASL